MKKLFPNNSHQRNYEGWHYLGNNGKYDFYVLPWELVNKDGRLTNGRPWLSVVFSNDPWDYLSPDYNHLFKNEQYRSGAPYDELYRRLIEAGYHPTGRNHENTPDSIG